jgi:hypothetical protein
MSLQAVRRYYEAPVEAAMQALGIPIRYENQLDPSGDASDEFIEMRLNFGQMTEPTTCGSIELIRGVFIVEYYGPKGQGPARAQQVMTETLMAINNLTVRPAERVNGVLGTALDIAGPSFTALDNRPYYFAAVSAGIVASYETP